MRFTAMLPKPSVEVPTAVGIMRDWEILSTVELDKKLPEIKAYCSALSCFLRYDKAELAALDNIWNGHEAIPMGQESTLEYSTGIDVEFPAEVASEVVPVSWEPNPDGTGTLDLRWEMELGAWAGLRYNAALNDLTYFLAWPELGEEIPISAGEYLELVEEASAGLMGKAILGCAGEEIGYWYTFSDGTIEERWN